MTMRTWRRWRRVLVTSGTAMLLGGCPLTDQQITSITQSAISTGINSLITSVLGGLLGNDGTTG